MYPESVCLDDGDNRSALGQKGCQIPAFHGKSEPLCERTEVAAHSKWQLRHMTLEQNTYIEKRAAVKVVDISLPHSLAQLPNIDIVYFPQTNLTNLNKLNSVSIH